MTYVISISLICCLFNVFYDFQAKKLDVSKRLSRLEISWKNSQFTDTIQLKTIALVQG